MPVSKTTKVVAKRSKPAVSAATKARVDKRIAVKDARVQSFTPQRASLYETKEQRLAQLDRKYTVKDMFFTCALVGETVLLVCMIAWR